ncbi:arabinose transporter [Pleomorphomonas carboxyditropha]|uniref:Arabinose transporter n=1 Tax=Pleomorphomonas carboxyditropha TaxID=2023338 RepID=A0A2G9WXR0_9HYPH|nr:arabinose transporter [Pleomorphomonas carboxyditropha]PIO99454.1 arabinose transporter [Pleomorphomonas carboxyditropha]
MTSAVPREGSKPSLAVSLLPMASVVFILFFVIGMAMPVLPLHVDGRLGLPAFVVGLVAGSQFIASLASRLWAGRFADARGGKPAIVIGCIVAAAAGLLYLSSLLFVSVPALSAAILILGRGVLGAAESLVITGALAWGLALGGPANAGKVIAWMGMPMFAAFALGAPFGSLLYDRSGFAAVALATMIAPLAAVLCVTPFAGAAPLPGQRPSMRAVLSFVHVPGLALALGSMGFGSITIFIALLFTERHWNAAWAAFTIFSVAFILARVLFGHLPDRVGGAKVALASLVIIASGQVSIWIAPSPLLAFVGSGLTGFGHSLLYPALGVEAVHRTPPESRAAAMGTYTAFLDLALGIAGPALGLIAGCIGIRDVFLVTAIMVMASAMVTLKLLPNGIADLLRRLLARS